jgi:hypothetical protein
MFINLNRLKAPEVRNLAKAYNKYKAIPRPSTLRKGELIKYLKDNLQQNKRGWVFVEHPELQKSIEAGINRIKKEDKEAKEYLETTFKNMFDEIERNRPKERKTAEWRDTLTKEQKKEQDKRLKHFIETGTHLYEPHIPKRTQKEIEKEKEIVRQLEEERQKERDERAKRNREIVKRTREELKRNKEIEELKKKKEKKKTPVKKIQKEEKSTNEEEYIDEDETPEEKKMRLYFASIKDKAERMKEIQKYMISLRKQGKL